MIINRLVENFEKVSMQALSFHENVVGRLSFDLFDREEENLDSIVVTSEGVLCELLDNAVVSTCAVNVSVQQPCQLFVFWSYRPRIKHYILYCGSVAIIVKKVENKLKVSERIQGLSQLRICDHLGLGFSQAILTFFNSSKIQITDFVTRDFAGCDINSVVQASNSLNASLISQLQAIKTKLVKSLSLLQDKMVISNNAIADCVSNFKVKESIPDIKLVPVQQPPQRLLQKFSDIIKTSKPYCYVFEEKLFVIIEIFNSSCLSLRNIHYNIASPNKLCSESILVMIDNILHGELRETLVVTKALKPNKSGFLISMIDEPICYDVEVTVGGSISFVDDQSIQGQVFTEKLILNLRKYDLNTFHHTLILLCCSFSYEIIIKATTDINQLLVKKLNFLKTNYNFYLLKESLYRIQNVLVQIGNKPGHLRVYCQRLPQLLVLFQVFKSVLPIDSQIDLVDSRTAISKLEEKLGKEIEFIISRLKDKLPKKAFPLKSNINISLTCDEWKEILKDYWILEAKTDFQLYNIFL